MFWNKKIDSDEYKKLYNLISNLESDMHALKVKVILLEEKFLTKIKKQRLEQIKESDEEDNPQLDEIRRAFGGDTPIEFQKNIKSSSSSRD